MSALSAKNNLQEWLESVGCLEHFNAGDLISGKTVHEILRNVVKGYTKQISPSNSVLHRVENWNTLIEQLKAIEIMVSQDSKSKIVNGNQDLVIEIVTQLRSYHSNLEKQSEVDIAQIDAKKDPNDSQSLLELLLILIMKNFGMSSKEAVALLSNEGKYLAHILTKGLKGDFKYIESLISDLHRCKEKILKFCKSSDNVIFFLRSVKPSVISKSERVSLLGFSFLNQILSNFPSKEQSEMLETHLLSTYILATRRHPQMEERIVLSLFQIGKESSNLLESILATSNAEDSDSVFLNILIVLWRNERFSQIVGMQGFLNKVNESVQNISRDGHTCTSLNIVMVLLQQYPDFFKSQPNCEQLTNCLSESEPINSAEYFSFINQCFALLEMLGVRKHSLAPSVLRILIAKFKSTQSQDESVLFLGNFSDIMELFPSIPWSMVVDALIQLKEAQKIELTETELQFLNRVVEVDSFDLKYGLVIYDMVSKLFMETHHLAGLAVMVLVKVVEAFKEEEIIQELTMKFIKVCLAIHNANFKRITPKRKSITGSSKIADPQEATLKIKNNAVEFLLLKICQISDFAIASQLEPILVFSYINVKDNKEHARGLKKVLMSIGNADELVEKYEKQIKKAEEEAKAKAEMERRKQDESSPKNHRYQNSMHEDGVNEIENSSRLTKKGHSISLMQRPLGVSYIGVTSSAQKGIEKYQRVFLQKIEKHDLEKIKAIEQAEKEESLKKLYKKKMLSNGINLKGETDEIRYLYDFDSQDNQIIEKHFLKVPFYTNESEQQRDLNAIEKLLKAYQKPLKLIFSEYTTIKKGRLPEYFDEYAEKAVYIHSSGIYKFLKDFYFQDYITLKQVQYLCQKINIIKNPKTSDYQKIDFQCFIEFFKQASFLMFTRPPKDLRGQPLSNMLEETFANLKLFANENRMNERNFEDPENIYFNQTEAVSELNRKLCQNPDLILPEGYKKIVEQKISFEYGVYLEAMSPTYKDVFEVIDEILWKALGVHVIEPFTKTETVTRARPSLFVAERIQLDSAPTKHISVFLKKEVSKIPIKSRGLAKDCAIVLDEIMEAVELGHQKVGLKHLNKIEMERKLNQEKAQKQFYLAKRKMQSRHREAKTAIEQYKDIKAEKEREASQQKQLRQKKEKEDRERREREDKQLKRKAEEYVKKKKEEEKQKLRQKKELEKKEREEREKFRQTNQETKKRLKEEREKRQQEEKVKEQERKKQERARQQLQKKKLQESQVMKKRMVEEFKMKRSGIRGSTVTKEGEGKNIEAVKDEQSPQ